MVGHKICFYGEMWLIIPELSLLLLLIWSSVPCHSCFIAIIHLKAVDGMSNSVDSDQFAPSGICTVCTDLSVSVLEVIRYLSSCGGIKRNLNVAKIFINLKHIRGTIKGLSIFSEI